MYIRPTKCFHRNVFAFTSTFARTYLLLKRVKLCLCFSVLMEKVNTETRREPGVVRERGGQRGLVLGRLSFQNHLGNSSNVPLPCCVYHPAPKEGIITSESTFSDALEWKKDLESLESKTFASKMK